MNIVELGLKETRDEQMVAMRICQGVLISTKSETQMTGTNLPQSTAPARGFTCALMMALTGLWLAEQCCSTHAKRPELHSVSLDYS